MTDLGTNNFLSIDTVGNIGIGTTTPAKTLSVQGSALISGDLSVANLTASGTITGVTAADVTIALGSGSPTVDQMQEYLDNTGSSGFFLGGAISDGGAGTVDIAAGSGFIRTTNDDNVQLLSFKWSASSTVLVTDNTTQYIYVDDDGVISLTTDEFSEAPDKVKLGVVTDEAGSIESTFSLGVRLQESVAEAGRFLRRVNGISRDTRRGGLILGESGDANRDVTMTTGALWWGKTEYTISAFDTSGVDTFDSYILNSKEDTATSTWDNLRFDSSGTLTELSNNRWANLFFFLEPDDHVVMVYGRAQFTTQAGAEMEDVPSSGLPTRLTETGVLTGRFTFQKSANTATIASAFDTTFNAAGVTDHGDLAGLSDDDHTQYLLVDGTRAMTGNLNLGSLNLNTTGGVYASSTSIFNSSLGIGTSTPSRLFSVQGDSLFSGNLTVAGLTATGTITSASSIIQDLTLGQLAVGGGTGVMTATSSVGNNLITTAFSNLFGTKSTSDLSEGSNLYYTEARWQTSMTGTTTLPEIVSLPSLLEPIKFSYASTTPWTGTSTRQMGVAISAETWLSATCYTTTGTLTIEFSDGTNLMESVIATATPSKTTFSTNNTFTAEEKQEFDVGSPLTTPLEIACTIERKLE